MTPQDTAEHEDNTWAINDYLDTPQFIARWNCWSMGIIEVRPVPGKVVWVGDCEIPWLGITRDTALTPAQEKALVDLFSISIVPDGKGVGKALFPHDVGRSVCVCLKDDTPVTNSRGEAIQDIQLKAVGLTRKRLPRYTLDKGDAVLESELARALAECGMRVYEPVAVIEPASSPGKAIQVLAERSMLRSIQITDLLSGLELARTITMLADRESKRGGWKKFDIRTLYEERVPYTVGENLGKAHELGVAHTGLTGRDNHGAVGEWVDLEDAHVGRKYANQKGAFWQKLRFAIEKINTEIGGIYEIDLSRAYKRMDAGIREVENAIRRYEVKLRLDRNALQDPAITAKHLRWLMEPYGKIVPGFYTFDKGGYMELMEREGLLQDRPQRRHPIKW
jgi:hypothetical protein